MSLESRINTSNWVYGSIALFLAFVLLIFNLWMRFFHLPEVEAAKQREENALQSVKTEQSAILKPEVRELFENYSTVMESVDILFLARDEVFTGSLDEEEFEPVVFLDYPDFFQRFQELLSKKAVISNLTIDPYGRISFLVQTTSYRDAAQQLKALRFGLAEERQRRRTAQELEEEDIETEEEEIPVLFSNLIVSSISRNILKSDSQDLPEVLSSGDSTYDFIVQMQINPDHYAYLYELKLDQQFAEDEEASSEE